MFLTMLLSVCVDTQGMPNSHSLGILAPTAAEIEGIFTAADAETGYRISAVVQHRDIERTVSVEVVVRD